MQVFPGVHRFESGLPGRPQTNSNVYLLEGPSGSMLIDSGWNGPGMFEGLERQFLSDGLRIGDVRKIVITHIHADHYGLAAKFREICGSKVMLHRAERATIRDRFEDPTEPFNRQMGILLSENGVPNSELAKIQAVGASMRRAFTTAPVDVEIEDGDILSCGEFNLEVIPTPGHTTGHMCLYDARKRLLFSADHVLPVLIPHVTFNPQSGPSPMEDFRNALTRLRGLDVQLVLPGHGEPFEDLKKRVDELLQYRSELERGIFQALDSKGKTAYELATMLAWTWSKADCARTYNDISSNDKRHAVGETLAHLAVLVHEGKAFRTQQNGLVKYSRAI